MAAELIGKEVQEYLDQPGAQEGMFDITEEIVSVEGDMRNLEEVRLLKLDVPKVETVAYRVSGVGALGPIGCRVHVLGDSYLDIHRDSESSFTEHLARVLGEPVYEVSVGGGGPTGARERWIADSGYEHAEVVVWVVAERYAGFSHLWGKLTVPE